MAPPLHSLSLGAAAARAPPVVASSAVSKERATERHLLGVRGGPVHRSEDEAAIRAVGGRRSSRYGEITPRGFAKLAARLELGEDDVFADLGSGTGRVLQAVRDHGVRVSCGVELSLTRHEAAVQKRDALEAHEANSAPRVC